MRTSPRFFKRPPFIVKCVLIGVVVGVVVILLYPVPWFGFGTYTDAAGEIVPEKTFWDWMQLFIVPAFLALGAVGINTSIQQIERDRAEKRAEVDRQIADDRLKEQTLQMYLDRMSELLLSGQFENPDTKEKAKTVARARTLTVLRGLDGERKGAVLRFLYEAGLITGDNPKIELHTADFREANLALSNLEGAHLDALNLEGAKLRLTNLKGASLIGTILRKASLEIAILDNSDLRVAFLEGANFESASLMDAKLVGAMLDKTNFRSANLKGVTGTPLLLDMAVFDENTILPDGSHWQPPSPPASQ